MPIYPCEKRAEEGKTRFCPAEPVFAICCAKSPAMPGRPLDKTCLNLRQPEGFGELLGKQGVAPPVLES